MEPQKNNLTVSWRSDIENPALPLNVRLRLAAIEGHMQEDLIVARRMALVDLLVTGQVIPRSEIFASVDQILGQSCWGKNPSVTLIRDLNVLRRGGIRIAYSRKKPFDGYYLQYPALAKDEMAFVEPPLPKEVRNAIRNQSPDQKLAAAFAMADYALQQKCRILALQNPDWSDQEVDIAARQQTFGSPHPDTL